MLAVRSMPTDRPLLLRVADAQPDTATEAELIGVLERFSSAFADRDADAVPHLFAPTDEIVVGYVRGALAAWIGGAKALPPPLRRRPHNLLVGVGSVRRLNGGAARMAARRGDRDSHERRPRGAARYRMTMVLERHRDHWLVRQVHGSSPN
jgi:hypothetical protein